LSSVSLRSRPQTPLPASGSDPWTCLILRIDPPSIHRERPPFFGRTRERAQLEDDLQRRAPLVSVVGPSGMGKSRLVRIVAGALEPSFRQEGGAWWVDLRNCASEAAIEAAVATALGIPRAGWDDLAAALDLQGRILLVLDGVDSGSSEAQAVIERWLRRCAVLQILATSILPLGFDDEVRFELGPMEVGDAVDLYLDRAHRAWSGRPRVPSEEQEVEELVRRLDRLPLAIELAAARVRVLSPRTLLNRLDDRLELLWSSAPGPPGSLFEALARSWSCHGPKEQEVLAQVSVFEGGFTLDAAAAVVDLPLRETLELVDRLRSTSLLQVEETDPPRFFLPEGMRLYARRELERIDPRGESLARHCLWFVERGEAELARLGRREDPSALRWLEAERRNLEAILHRVREPGSAHGGGAGRTRNEEELAARAGRILGWILQREDYPAAGMAALEATVEAARACEDVTQIARALGHLGAASARQGWIDEGLAYLQEALSLATGSAGREQVEGELCAQLASVHLQRGDFSQAAPSIARAMQLGAALRLPLLEATAMIQEAWANVHRSGLEQAALRFEQGLAILRRHGDYRREAAAVSGLASVRVDQGLFREARQTILAALKRYRESGAAAEEASVLASLAAVELGAGRLDLAADHAGKSLAMLRALEDRPRIGSVLGTLGLIAMENGDLAGAEAGLLEGIGVLEEVGARHASASFLPFVAALEARLGRDLEARRSLEDARAHFEPMGDEVGLVLVELIGAALDLELATRLPPAESAKAQELRRGARKRLELARRPEASRSGRLGYAIRLVERALDEAETGAREGAESPSAEGLRIGQDAEWFEVPGKERVDIRNRAAIRKILGRLAQKRLDAPSEGCSSHELFDVGWPEAKIDPEAAVRRVYISIWTLRNLGLSDLILSQADGYLLDPAMPLIVEAG